MASVTGKTAAAMQAIADASVVSGAVDVSGHLQLTTHGGSQIDAGDVIGPTGPTGLTGPQGPSGTAPTGGMIMFGAAIPPTGWLLCDGSAVSRSTYSALFAVIGTTYGAGNGTSTFNLPNFGSKMPRQDTTNLGLAGGTTPTNHSHAVDGGSPRVTAHITLTQGSSGGNVFIDRQIGDTWTANFNADETSTRTDGSTTKSNGAGVSGNTATHADSLPPFLNVNFIIKY